MVVLALDTATRQGSAALLMDETCDVTVGDPVRTHGERLPRELTALLDARGLTLQDVDLFAIVSGPGSFTGLRVGMAAIQGLALVTGRPVVPVPTLDAMAEGVNLQVPEFRGSEVPEVVIPCLDGQRNDVFFAAWRGAERLIEPSVGTAYDLVRSVRDAEIGAPAVIVGIGLERHAEVIGQLGIPMAPISRSLAEAAARIAARRPDLATSPHALRPLYVRRPDAELARERAGMAR
jgi:tRNA threonylcarbamoyladenosine biosynthesis protein TsaB